MGIGCGILIYLAIAATAFWAFWIVVRWLFFRPSVVPGDTNLITACTKCDYSLDGLGASPTCPECNTYYPTIYTTHARTEWTLRRDLVWHWVVAALWCIGLWYFFAYVFPPALTGLVSLFKGWPVAQRVDQLMQSRVYPWETGYLTLTLSMAWIASCALSHRCHIRELCLAFAICGGAALSISLVAAASNPEWVNDWTGYFWSRGGSPAAATFGTVSGITLVACMLIDTAAHENKTSAPLPDAISSTSATPNVITLDSEAS